MRLYQVVIEVPTELGTWKLLKLNLAEALGELLVEFNVGL